LLNGCVDFVFPRRSVGVVATNLGKYLIDDGKWYTKPLVKASQLFLKTPEQVCTSASKTALD
jgi:hypothetical protein